MKKPMTAGIVTTAALALGVTLAGCGSETGGDATKADETTTSETTTTTEETPTAGASGPNYTIVDYIRDNDITETPVKRGDPGTPTVDLPMPPGWRDAGNQAPEWAWGAIVYEDPSMAADPPSIIALMSKLTGDVDPEKILEYAPGELRNLPGYKASNKGKRSTLGGFDAFQIGGMYEKNGVERLIAQKTVVIPGRDGLYVLQLNADGLEDQAGPLMDATSIIDEETTITP